MKLFRNPLEYNKLAQAFNGQYQMLQNLLSNLNILLPNGNSGESRQVFFLIPTCLPVGRGKIFRHSLSYGNKF